MWGGGDWEDGNNKYTLLYKIDNSQESTVQNMKIYSTVCNKLYGKKEWVYIYICITDSLCCAPETNTIL